MNIQTRNNIKVTGSGQPILFSHGYGCDQSMWRFIVPAFEKTNQVILFDHVGAGNSDISAYSRSKYNSLEGYSSDVLEIMESLDLKDVIFVGHSVSATIGILAALKDSSRFAKLVLVGPSPSYINEGDYVGGFTRKDIEGLLESLDSNYLGWSSSMAPVIMGNPDRPELGSELTNSFCRTNPDIAKHFAKVTFLSDNRKELPLLTLPSLVLQCTDDLIAPTQVGEYVANQIPKSKLVYLNATGHCPHLSAPEETIEAIKSFIPLSFD